ncbi:ATP-dependent Clp protease ATP-binding subunit ClpX [Laedolimicola ammoniilytica]|uniref:ATP-dependent Clp protease ATP-binding subunit ClpX n=1 Tax=Laedolimicola ammoniilytica TaxID=2981771 RepID=A0ABT2RZZ6_9FIRM|nr:ATP-dependent Clp protease ATP-binding subunit ClpX [Laedolimicola ammoniilytica]MCU6697823.1 ATP-dependent Clp protease ATP-binding subunit ClpX [Laedolimicola ammoniilytica]SCI48468.1 ATP-dependent Clp protease ATP-binding subunit ClpX [uncultured Clostridium sp.]
MQDKDYLENENENTTPDNVGQNTMDTKDDGQEYERFCFLCRRPESQTGKLITLTDGISVCPDCMQKTMDTIQNGNIDFSRLQGVNFLNLSDLQNMMPNQQQVKKKKPKKEEPRQEFDIRTIPAPHKLKASLDEYVIGQAHAKKVISVAVYNHYKRVATGTQDDIEIEKSNILLIGPTGSGKTYLVKTLAKLLDVPLAIADATSLTEAGYIGDDIESVISKLLAAADNDVEKAERGIVFIDEIDKIAKKKDTHHRDVSGESVQQGLLKLLEGAEVEVPVGASSKNAMVPLTTVNTRNILFICGGAFPDLENVIKERLNQKSSMGFQADLKDKYDKEPNLLSKVTVEDLRNFGMIPEFLGRLPIICTLSKLDKDMLVRILKEPKNAILKQYQKLLALDEVDLQFNDGALEAIAEEALKRDTGARALRAIIEEFMLDIMYEVPKDDNIGRVTITREYIEHRGGPVIAMRGVLELEQQD